MSTECRSRTDYVVIIKLSLPATHFMETDPSTDGTGRHATGDPLTEMYDTKEEPCNDMHNFSFLFSVFLPA